MITIAEERSEFDMFLNELRGTHGKKGKELTAQIAMVVGGLTVLVLVTYFFLKTEDLRQGMYLWLVVVGMGMLGYETLGHLLSLGTSYTVDTSGILKNNIFRSLSWNVRAPEIQRIELDVSRAPTLTIRTVDDRVRTMKLPRSAEAQLHRFYPRLLRDSNGRLAKSDAPLARPEFMKWTIIAVVVLASLIGGALLYLNRG